MGAVVTEMLEELKTQSQTEVTEDSMHLTFGKGPLSVPELWAVWQSGNSGKGLSNKRARTEHSC